MVIGSIGNIYTYKRAWYGDDHPYYILSFDIAFMFAIVAGITLVKYIHDASNRTVSKSKTPLNDINHDIKSEQRPSDGAVVPVLDRKEVNSQ